MNLLTIKTFLITSLALIAFAGNSILCRLALGEQHADAAGFTLVRLVSATLVLSILLLMTKLFASKSSLTETKPIKAAEAKGSWLASLMLFLYAVTFSYAYLLLDTGTGALILFGAVQLTMITASYLSGKKLNLHEWLGVVVSFSGLTYLVIPSVATPNFLAFVLMLISGIAWGIYTLKGKNSVNPLSDTSYNFIRTFPLVVILALISFKQIEMDTLGLVYAVTSGAIASGLGYAIWYLAIKNISITQAGVLQLLVPILATLGGVTFASEQLTTRLIIASVLVLGGIVLVIAAGKLKSRTKPVTS
ncbi:DMT family transporter [Catenovulum maritimum]|uniref:DMT family transporter n=1 Tax=Catenovulum maritimum TaxID=1513271 RepID=UPI000A6F2E47|nr:DMT family transporter [Catenovulum maritimum]